MSWFSKGLDTIFPGVNDAYKSTKRTLNDPLGNKKIARQQQDALEYQQQQDRLLEQQLADEQQRTQDAQAQAEAQTASRYRRRRELSIAQGRRSTILTSPLGISDNPQTRRPTLLGA